MGIGTKREFKNVKRQDLQMFRLKLNKCELATHSFK